MVNEGVPADGRGAAAPKGDGVPAAVVAFGAPKGKPVEAGCAGSPAFAAAGEAGWLPLNENGLLGAVALVGVALNAKPAGGAVWAKGDAGAEAPAEAGWPKDVL